jgi:3-oxoadipate enol-lactonase
MPKAPVNGIELYYESHGQGPAIVFAHGAGGNHLSWWQQVPFFSWTHRCITFDHRGWGASVETPGGPGASAFVEDLKQLLDDLGVAKTFLVAQSMGGRTCLGFALAYPERTLGLVLGDTTGGVGDPEVLRARRQATRRREPALLCRRFQPAASRSGLFVQPDSAAQPGTAGG